MILGSGTRDCFHNERGLYCSIVLAYCSLPSNPFFTVLWAKFMIFPWQPLLFSYLHLSVSHFICGLRLAVPDLHFYCHLLGKQSLLPDPRVIIRKLENEFDSCHFLLLDHLDEKIRPNFFFFHIYFNVAQQLTPYN